MDLFPFLADLMDKLFGCLLCKHICSRMDYLFVAFFVAYGIIVEEVHDEMKTGLNANQLKFIAIVAMTLDHLTWTLWPGYDRQWYVLALHILGRLTAPIMWFFIAEGYHHTRSVKKYAMRLFALAVVSHFAYNFCFNIPFVPFRTGVFNQTGVVWSLGWGLLMLWVNDAPKLKPWMKTAFFLLMLVVTFPSDWSCIAAMAVFFLGANRGNFRRQMVLMMVCTVLYALVYFLFIDKIYALVQLGTCLTIPLLRLYNGKRGSFKPMGKLFYVYYPAHLLGCGLLRILLWGADFVTATANF